MMTAKLPPLNTNGDPVCGSSGVFVGARSTTTPAKPRRRGVHSPARPPGLHPLDLFASKPGDAGQCDLRIWRDLCRCLLPGGRQIRGDLSLGASPAASHRGVSDLSWRCSSMPSTGAWPASPATPPTSAASSTASPMSSASAARRHSSRWSCFNRRRLYHLHERIMGRLVWAQSARQHVRQAALPAVRLARFNVSNEHGEQHHFSFLGLPRPRRGGGGRCVHSLMQQDLVGPHARMASWRATYLRLALRHNLALLVARLRAADGQQYPLSASGQSISPRPTVDSATGRRIDRRTPARHGSPLHAGHRQPGVCDLGRGRLECHAPSPPVGCDFAAGGCFPAFVAFGESWRDGLKTRLKRRLLIHVCQHQPS